MVTPTMNSPNMTGTWNNKGVNWKITASRMKLFNNNYPSFAFDTNTAAGIASTGYIIGPYYRQDNGDYMGDQNKYSTPTTNGEVINGEWLQIQSDIPIKMTNYTFYHDNIRVLKKFSIVGSNDGSTWDLLQTVDRNYNGADNIGGFPWNSPNYILSPTTTTLSTYANNFNIVETVVGNQNVNNSYKYFRIINQKIGIQMVWGGIGKWNVKFSKA
jgi:hypothetical protein